MSHRRSRRAWGAAVLMAALGLTGPAGLAAPAPAPAAGAGPSPVAEGRTWVVDAVDDLYGNRWVSEGTGTPELTVAVGDVVEWQFDDAVIDHDLTSQDTRTPWAPALAQYRVPDGPPVRYQFTEPGVYDYLCSIHGTLMRGSVVVEQPGEPTPGLPAIEATASPSSGAAPASVAFSTEVTTTGPVAAFAEGLGTYPDLSGTARLVRARGRTSASLDVVGLKPQAEHMVHVHEQACASSRGGAHFRFDDALPFGPDNEIWLPFTSDAEGRSGPVAVTAPQRAGPKAVSIVVHDPDNPANRIGCVDLQPGTAGLAYAWDFGDGATGQGSDPEHTYAAAGTYTATVAVSDPEAGQQGTVTDTVEVVVADATAPDTRIDGGPAGTVRARGATFRLASSEPTSTFTCSLDGRAWLGCASTVAFRGLLDGRHEVRVRATDAAGNTDGTPASRRWTVDTTGPLVRDLRPTGRVRDRTPTVRARVTDRLSRVLRRDVVLRVDGRRVAGVRHDARGRLRWTPSRPLAAGSHTVRLAASDVAGNRTVRSWRFSVRR